MNRQRQSSFWYIHTLLNQHLHGRIHTNPVKPAHDAEQTMWLQSYSRHSCKSRVLVSFPSSRVMNGGLATDLCHQVKVVPLQKKHSAHLQTSTLCFSPEKGSFMFYDRFKHQMVISFETKQWLYFKDCGIINVSRSQKLTHLIIIIHDVLLDLGGVHPSDKIFHISGKSQTVDSWCEMLVAAGKDSKQIMRRQN